MSDETILELSRTRVILYIVGSLAVAVPGVWMATLDSEFILAFRRFNSPPFIHGFGIFLIFVAVLGGLYGVRKLLGDRRGLVLNDAGVLDCTHGISAGLIPWSEIAGAELVKLASGTVLAVKLKEPTKYLDRQGALRRPFFAANHDLCGSPVAISVSLFKTKPSDLLTHFSRYQEKYGNA